MAKQGIMNWRKASRSATGEQCIAVGSGNGTIAVKDTKNWDGPTLSISGTAWTSFLSTLR
jgi:hypothetical protein